MKKVGIRLASIFGYLLALILLLKIPVIQLIDLKLLALVIFGMVILTLPYYEKNKKWMSWLPLMGHNALEAGYLQALLLLFLSLSNTIDSSKIYLTIAMNCRSILYGYCLYVLFMTDEKQTAFKSDVKTESCSVVKEKKQWSVEAVYQFFRMQGLTAREAEVAKLICNGMTNVEIAEELCISEATVKKHVSHIFEKLHIDKREALKQMLYEGKDSV